MKSMINGKVILMLMQHLATYKARGDWYMEGEIDSHTSLWCQTAGCSRVNNPALPHFCCLLLKDNSCLDAWDRSDSRIAGRPGLKLTMYCTCLESRTLQLQCLKDQTDCYVAMPPAAHSESLQLHLAARQHSQRSY